MSSWDPRRHRHFIGFPVFLAVVCASLVGGAGSMAATVIPEVQHSASPEASVFHGEGLVRAQVRSMEFTGVHGAYEVIETSSSITVAALSTPVLIRDGASVVLVPARTQWRTEGGIPLLSDGIGTWTASHTVKPLTERYLRESLTSRAVQQGSASMAASFKDHEFFDLLRLPLTQEKVVARRAVQRISDLQQALRENNLTSVESLLMDSTLDPESRQRTLLSALFMSSLEPYMSLRVQEELLQETDIALLLMVHPEVAVPSWSAVESGFTSEEMFALLFAFPQANTGLESQSTFLYERWEQDLLQTLVSLNKPDVLLQSWMSALLPVVEWYEKKDLPVRRSALVRSFDRVVNAHRFSVSQKTRDLLDSMMSEDQTVDKNPQSQPQEPSKQDNDVFDKDEVYSEAYGLLQAAQALFTVETEIVPLRASQARVSHIRFGTPDGDVVVSFLLDTTQEIVTEIVLNGKTLPNPMPLAGFLEWLRK